MTVMDSLHPEMIHTAPHGLSPRRYALLGLVMAALSGGALLLASLLDLDPDLARTVFTASRWLGLGALATLFLTAVSFHALTESLPSTTLQRTSTAFLLGPAVLYCFTLALMNYVPGWFVWVLWGVAFLGTGVVLEALDTHNWSWGRLVGGGLLATFLLTKLFEAPTRSRYDLAWVLVIAGVAVVVLVVAPLRLAWTLRQERQRFGATTDLVTASLLGAAVAQLAALLWAGWSEWNTVATAPADSAAYDKLLQEVTPTLWRVSTGLYGVVAVVLALWFAFLSCRCDDERRDP